MKLIHIDSQPYQFHSVSDFEGLKVHAFGTIDS